MARILIIDDDDALRATIAATLHERGHEVIEATNGTEGLVRQATRPADLVITDLVMPEREGIETIIELRKRAPKLAIIAMSGSAKPDLYLKMAMQFGACETLVKPFTTEALIAAMDHALSDKAAPKVSVSVLVVDDDANGRFLTVHRLKREFPELKILEAEHATAALELLAQSKVDAVITDNGIGPKDGLTMIRELRQDHFDKPIIMASMNPLLERKALEAGANAFVYSADENEIIRLLKSYLEKGGTS